MTSDATVRSEAEKWLAQDPDGETRAELQTLIDGDPAELAARFAGRLEFGTAGLRGAIGAGPLRMNRVLVAQAAAGLAAFLLSRDAHPSVVIGYDGRKNSRVFALDSAEVMQGAGVRVTLLPRELPTPVLAFAVRHLDASAGVMVTASHNPAGDNGYKVYLGGDDGGSQIVPPTDGQIAAHIAAVAEGSIADLPRSQDYTVADEDVLDAYVARTAALFPASTKPTLTVVYTPMHGVGWETYARVMDAAGIAQPKVVVAQQLPDPHFPTVAFPNPEEPGALDLAFALAAEEGADLVIANDPDADRVAVGIPSGSGWRRLTGNEVGWLLGWQAARGAADGSALACSIVSSPALAEVAAAFRLRHVETLTGFKWISRVPGLAFGYEEALGYLVDSDKVRDKDGISAAVAVLGLASELAARGATLADHLVEFAQEFGGYASGQVSIRVTDLADIGRMMARLRATPPTAIGGIAVASAEDFLAGDGGFGANDILRYRLADGSRVIVRPSGTEPKLKAYLDAVSTNGDGATRLAAAQATIATLDAGVREVLEASPPAR